MLVKTITALNVQEWDGEPIKRPGIYSGIPLDLYHSADICVEPSISSSGLRLIYSPFPWVKASPAHYWCQSPYNPDAEEDDDEKEAFILGRAAHHLLFGEAAFHELFIVRPATINGETWHGNKTICKLWLEKQRDAGLCVLTPDHLKRIKGIARELAKEPLINDPEGKRSGILNGYIEHSWFFKHRTGVWIKVRPDATPNDSLDFVDLKLTRSILWPDMQRTIRDLGYFQQAGLTAMAVKAILGQPVNSYSFVFAENTEPHCIDFVTLKENEIQRGVEACEIAINRFAKCMRENRWPGPRGDRADAQYIEFSKADQERIDEQLAIERKELESGEVRRG